MMNETERRADDLHRQVNLYKTPEIPPNFNPAKEPTLGELFVILSEDVSTLVHKEIEFARVEVGEKLEKATGGIINLALGAIFILLGGGALLAAAILALGAIFAYWISALVVGGLVVFIGFLLVQSGQAHLRLLTLLPEKSLASLKRDTEMVKEKFQ